MTETITEKKDLYSLFPMVAAEWDYDKNAFAPTEVKAFSCKKAWWKCSKGHSWEAVISTRSKGSGCPYCYGRMAIVGVNDLQTTRPDLAAEWDYENNNPLKPTDFKQSSGKKVWWKCHKCNNSWQAIIDSRNRTNCGCPYCSIPPKKIKAGVNDLKTLNPELASEWNNEKNLSLRPTDVSVNSNKRVWWTCQKCGGEWTAVISSRSNGVGCPFCSGRRPIQGVNDLMTTHPEIVCEWDYSRNTSIHPSDVSFGSEKKVWWLGSCGHHYKAGIINKVKGQGCPICRKRFHSSFPEQAIYYYISKDFPDAVNGDKNTIDMELDIYIPSKHIAIEYDGYRWHSNKGLLEVEKNNKCKQYGICLIRVREEGLSVLEDCFCIMCPQEPSDEELNEAIRKVIKKVGGKEDNIDVQQDRYSIYNAFLGDLGKRSFGYAYPELLKDWDYNKNESLQPYSVYPNSGIYVWWSCHICGYTWRNRLCERTKGHGCPACAHKRIALRSQKSVLCIETGEVFDSLTKAAEKYKISISTLSVCCKGKTKTAAGYHWKYDDLE